MKFCLPQSSPYDPAEDPPASVDPLGTVTGAEQLAEVLLPGVTARMWRVRLLTFAALAADVSKRASKDNDDRLMDARLAFERLFVSAIARQESGNSSWRKASRRLPGIGLARQSLVAGDQPLQRANFLKGQGVNGPFGVMARLARDIGLVDEDGQLERIGSELLLAWGEDQELSGLLDEKPGSDGANWIRKIAQRVSSFLDDDQGWPGANWSGWEDLATRLRPDQIGSRERNVMLKLLSYDPLGIRDLIIRRLAKQSVFSIYHSAISTSDRGAVEKEIIVNGLGDATAADEVGRSVNGSINLIDAYEVLSGLLESVFRGLVWGLTRNNGQASRSTVVQDPTLRPFLREASIRLGPAVSRFQQKLELFELDHLARKRDSVDLDRMHKLLDDSLAASKSNDDCVSAVMDRHVRVQKEKGKGVWIEQDKQWTLMPGFGDTGEEPRWHDSYLHPYRVTNVYEMLADLGVVPELGTMDAEEENQ